jgi:Family of unknown function (DUF6194)
MSESLPAGPTPDELTAHIKETFPDTAILAIPGATFFSLDAERHFPNFATIVTNDDDYDEGARLSRDGVFRINVGVNRGTFERLVGDVVDPDYAALDALLPHPTYARQHWLGILNPSHETFDTVIRPLLDEAHERLATQRARHGLDAAQEVTE